MFGEFSPPINTAPYQSKKLKMQSKISVGINRRLLISCIQENVPNLYVLEVEVNYL